jgi:hypothetical protein
MKKLAHHFEAGPPLADLPFSSAACGGTDVNNPRRHKEYPECPLTRNGPRPHPNARN